MLPFYYAMLSSKSQNIYNAILDAVANGKNDVFVDLSCLQEDELNKIIEAVFDDNPQFYTESNWKCTYTDEMLTFKTPIVSVYNSKEDIGFLLRFAQAVRKNCFTEYEKIKYVHDFMINSIKFDHEEIETKKFDRANHQAIGALYTGKSVCEGIARLTQLLLQMCGVQAIYCSGRTLDNDRDDDRESNGHAWTVVSINGKYYHLDVSHDICLTKAKNQKSYCYFNLTYEDIIKDHQLDYDAEFRRLSCDSVHHNYFHYNKLLFSSLNELKIALNTIVYGAIVDNDSSKFFQFKVSNAMMKEFSIPWYQICLSTIYEVIDKLELENPSVGIGFDAPYYNDEQGVFSINFTFGIP